MPVTIPAHPTPEMVAAADRLLLDRAHLGPREWRNAGEDVARAMFGEDVDPAVADAIGGVLENLGKVADSDEREPVCWANHGKRIWAATSPFCTELPPLRAFARGGEAAALVPVGQEILLLGKLADHDRVMGRWLPEGSDRKYEEELLPRNGFSRVPDLPLDLHQAFLETYRARRDQACNLGRLTPRDPVLDALREHFETPRKASLWGQPHEITPAVSLTAFGDGLRLMWVEPTNTRPNHYVVRVDSSWIRPEMGQHIDAVLSVLEEEFGSACDEDDEGQEIHNPFPALDLDSGVSWSPLPWPREIAPPGAVLLEHEAVPGPIATPGEDEAPPPSRGI